MERAITARGLQYTSHEYPGTEHWFAESAEATFVPGAAALALDRTASFLASTSR
ncbi:MAG: dienelactone hydrolase family protein [Microthrixaceae bacterium]|nr:dienelactone hydrolase family protein [Microthrixaceae bacterium]